MIAGQARKEQIGEISIAGPIVNIFLAFASLGAASLIVPFSPFNTMLLLIASFNAFIAVFNLIPFGILDGFKIFSWNKAVWAIAFALSGAVTIYTYFLV